MRWCWTLLGAGFAWRRLSRFYHFTYFAFWPVIMCPHVSRLRMPCDGIMCDARAPALRVPCVKSILHTLSMYIISHATTGSGTCTQPQRRCEDNQWSNKISRLCIRRTLTDRDFDKPAHEHRTRTHTHTHIQPNHTLTASHWLWFAYANVRLKMIFSLRKNSLWLFIVIKIWNFSIRFHLNVHSNLHYAFSFWRSRGHKFARMTFRSASHFVFVSSCCLTPCSLWRTKIFEKINIELILSSFRRNFNAFQSSLWLGAAAAAAAAKKNDVNWDEKHFCVTQHVSENSLVQSKKKKMMNT